MKHPITLKFSTLFITFSIFFGHIIPVINYYQLITFIFLLSILSVYKNNGNISIKKNLHWISCILILIISLIFSQNNLESFKFLAMFTCIISIKMLYEEQKNWQHFMINCFFIASFIHVLFTVLQLFFPDIVTIINALILSPVDFTNNMELLARGVYAGITGQTGINSFFISIFVAITLVKLVSNGNKYKILLSISLSLGLVILLLTGKRSQLIIDSLAIVFIFALFLNKREYFKNTLIIFLSITVIILSFFLIPELQIIIEKFSVLANSSDFTNGRKILWENTMKIFYENPLIGIGIGSIFSNLGEMSHNIYIQLLGETGVMGFTVFFIAFSYSLFYAITLYLSIKRKGKNTVMISQIFSFSIFLQLYFILYGLSGNPLYSPIFLLSYMLVQAMIHSIDLECKAN